MNFVKIEPFIHQFIHFYMIEFPKSSFLPVITSHPTAQFPIKSILWFNMTLQLSLDFFSHHSETLSFTAERDVAKMLHQKHSWTKRDLSIWQRSPQRTHTCMKWHRWEQCHPAKHPAELTAYCIKREDWCSFVWCQCILRLQSPWKNIL